jgi:hypothetical protein
MLISTALLLDSIIRNSVCTPAKLPCRRVAEGKVDITLERLKNEMFEHGEEQQPGSDLRQNVDKSAVEMKFENSQKVQTDAATV